MNPCTGRGGSYAALSLEEQEQLLEKVRVVRVQGRDRRGHKLVQVIAKFFPARVVSGEALRNYLTKRVFPELDDGGPFSVVYVNTGASRGDNFPGITALRSIHDAIPETLKTRMATVYFVHPSLQARLFLAALGRFLLSGEIYGKVRYVSRLEFLWCRVRRNEVDVPEFVSEHDKDLNRCRPMMYFGLESDRPRLYGGATSVDSGVDVYSMRCIA